MIDIAKILLKNPQMKELYSPIFGSVLLNGIHSGELVVKLKIEQS